MKERRGAAWKAFIVAACVIAVVSVIVSTVISAKSVSVVKTELCNTNFSKAEEVGKNFRQIINQVDRLSVGIGVSSDIKLFFSSRNPQNLIDGFNTRIKNVLSSYAFSMRDTTTSVMIYSPANNWFMSEDLGAPYVPDGSKTDATNNAEWVQQLTSLGKERSRVSYTFRATNNSYPYVMTLIHQMANDGYEGVVAVDIDLKKIYTEIRSDTDPNASIWVLDRGGRVIVEENKRSLFQLVSAYPLLASFEKNETDQSILLKGKKQTVAFAQKYLEDLECYVVVATRVDNIDDITATENLNTIIVGASCAALAIALIYLYTYYTSKPMHRMLEMLRNPLLTKEYKDDEDPSVKETADYIVSYMQTNNELEVELGKRLTSLRDTQLQALKAQINPHFLFNTLNIIMMLLDSDEPDPRAAKVTMNLSDVLRFALTDEHLVPLREELSNARKYVEILEVRYGGKFHTNHAIDESLLDAKVPRLILQPIIENAVFHGISAKEIDICELAIKCWKDEKNIDGIPQEFVCVEISDSGAGMTEETVSELMASLYDERISMKHIGIQNVARRLRLLYPKDSSVHIQSVLGQGTTVTLSFPYTSESETGTETR